MIKKFSDTEIVKRFTNKDKAKIIVYIERMYDQKSDLNKIQDLSERKKTAMSIAKLDPNNEDMIQIMELKNEEVFELIDYYLSYFQNSNRYHKLLADQQLLDAMLKQLMKPIEPKDDEDASKIMKARNDISEMIDELRSRVEHNYSDIYGTNDVKELAERKVKKMLSPELRLKSNKS